MAFCIGFHINKNFKCDDLCDGACYQILNSEILKEINVDVFRKETHLTTIIIIIIHNIIIRSKI